MKGLKFSGVLLGFFFNSQQMNEYSTLFDGNLMSKTTPLHSMVLNFKRQKYICLKFTKPKEMKI